MSTVSISSQRRRGSVQSVQSRDGGVKVRDEVTLWHQTAQKQPPCQLYCMNWWPSCTGTWRQALKPRPDQHRGDKGHLDCTGAEVLHRLVITPGFGSMFRNESNHAPATYARPDSFRTI